jgi:hypothetical protein
MVTKILKVVLIIFIFLACDDLGTLLDDNKPKIDGGLKVSKDKVYPQDTINCSVDATNPIEGDLSYAWKNTGGRFIYPTNLSTVKWIAPNESGNYTLTVEVTNTEGTSDASKKIEVLVPQQPVINGNIVLSATSVLALDTVTASVSATNPRPGPLSYTWSKTGGNWVNGIFDDDTVKWIAPLSGGNYTLTVVVSNGLSSAQTSRQVNVVSSSAPIVHITEPVNNALSYLGDPIKVKAEAAHENGISLVRLYAITPNDIDSLIQTKGTSIDGKYTFDKLNAYKDLVGYSTLKVEAEAQNQLKTKGSDQISIQVLGIHVGKNGRE